MTELLDEIEAVPASYPSVPKSIGDILGCSKNFDSAWRRIEAYVRVRWTSRTVTWIVEGSGDFTPPLTPVNSATTECWDGLAWTVETLDASFLGGWVLPGRGPYRIAADVGGGAVPPEVDKAFERYVLYCLHDTRRPDLVSANSISLTDGDVQDSYTRSNTWVAKALQNSGSADLLRPYRRVK